MDRVACSHFLRSATALVARMAVANAGGSAGVKAGAKASLFAGVMAIAAGCAAPVPIVTNVVRDADVRGCSPKSLERLAGLDVAIVIDTSLSTRRPSGIDVDGDGVISRFRRNPTFDRGDSRLAVMVDAIRPLLRNAAEHDIRFSIVSFSGPTDDPPISGSPLVGTGSESKLYAKLSKSTPELERALTEVLAGGSQGTSVFYAGMHLGSHSLTSSTNGARRRVVLFLADGPRPTGMAPTGVDGSGNLIFRDSRMKTAALMARERNVVFHTFGLSHGAGLWRHQPLGQIAGATGGNYHAVEDPSELYCHLAHSLMPPSSESDWERMFTRVKREQAAAK